MWELSAAMIINIYIKFINAGQMTKTYILTQPNSISDERVPNELDGFGFIIFFNSSALARYSWNLCLMAAFLSKFFSSVKYTKS